MDTSLKTKRQRERRETSGRDHVRPADQSGAHARPMLEPQPRRMKPLSRQTQASSEVSVSRRRAERRARKKRAQAQRPATTVQRRRIRPAQIISWRAVSGMIVLGLSLVLYIFLTENNAFIKLFDEESTFFIHSVEVGFIESAEVSDQHYLTREEIFRDSGIAGKNIFTIDPQKVQARLEAKPDIADAQVHVKLPHDVQILVKERQPTLIWEQAITRGADPVHWWVDINGIVMKLREDRPDLLRIVVQDNLAPDDEQEDTAWNDGSLPTQIPVSIVHGARYLRERFPSIDVLLYDPMKGLGHHDSRGWTVWFGAGDDMEAKLLVYLQLIEDILAQGIQPGEIMMADPDRPYFTVLWRDGN